MGVIEECLGTYSPHYTIINHNAGVLCENTRKKITNVIVHGT